jgi:formylglycine-generating enzyme required for sulfatase activity
MRLAFAGMSMAASLLLGETAPPPPAAAGTADAAYPLWDGQETVAEYAKRAGIRDVETSLDLGQVFLDLGAEDVTLKLTLIPAGKFAMGSPSTEVDRSPDEGPQHEVTISKPFYMGVYEVTRRQYERIMGPDPKAPVTEKDKNQPVHFLNPSESAAFCEKASVGTGWKLSLPTEAQWEYACRAGTTTRASFGDASDPAIVELYAGARQGGTTPSPVGLAKPNPWGLHDLYGNVQEWCRDFYDANIYGRGPATDPIGPTTGKMRVLRGGMGSGKSKAFRSAARGSKDAMHHYPFCGFRVVAEVPAPGVQAAPQARRVAPRLLAASEHLTGVAICPGDPLKGTDDVVLSTLERQTSLRFRRVYYGRPERGMDLQWWAKTFRDDVETGRKAELRRMLAKQPAFVLLMAATGKRAPPVWISEAVAAYGRAGGIVIEEGALANLPAEAAVTTTQDNTHLWARAWENALRNACHQPGLAARVVVPADAQTAGGALQVKVTLSTPSTAKLKLVLEDRSGNRLVESVLPTSADVQREASLALPADLFADAYHVVVRDADTARETGCAFVSVTQPVSLALADDGRRYGQDGTVVVTAVVSCAAAAVPEGWVLKWVLRDYRRGVIACREEPLTLRPGTAAEKTFAVRMLDTDTKAWVYWVQALIEKDGKPLVTAERRVYRWRPFTMREDLVFGTWHVESDKRPEAARPLIAQYLRAMGIRSGLEETSEISQRAGLRATSEHRGMTAVTFAKVNPNDMTGGWLLDGRKNFGRKFDSPSIAMWSLGEETGFGGNWSEAYPWRKLEQAPEEAAFWFREYLKQRYATLDALNTSWGARFADWKDVQYLRKYAYPYGWLFVEPAKDVERNLAPYVDTHAFAEWWVHELVTSTVKGLREVNPVPAWTKSYEFTFVDWCEAPMTHFLAATDPHGTALWNAYARRKTPGTPPAYHLNWGFFDDPRQMSQFWLLGVLSGATYIDNWGPTMSWDFTYTPAGVQLRDLAKQLEPVANLILQARQVEDLRVGIFVEETPWQLVQGRPGYYLKGRAPGAQTYGPTTQSPPGASWLASPDGPLYSALCDAGYSPCYLTRDEIPQAKVIFLPYTEALAAESAARLKAFVEAGGTLVALPRLAEYDEGGHPYDALPGAGMRELFGLTTEDKWIGRPSIMPLPGPNDAAAVMIENWQIGQPLPPEQKAEVLSFNIPSSYAGQPLRLISETHQAVASVAEGTKVLSRHEDGTPALTYRKTGKGSAIFLNVFRSYPPTLNVPTDERDAAFARVLGTLAEYAGVLPDAWFETLDSNGTVAPQLAHFTYTGPNGILRMKAVYNDWRSPDVEARFVLNTNVPVAAVYDVLSGRRLPLRTHLGRPSAFVDVPRGTGRLLAILPYEVTGVTVKAAPATVTAGNSVAITASLTAVGGSADIHPGELTVFGPDGAPVRDAARHVMLDGKPTRVPTYLDLPVGDYRIVVQDGATRTSGFCTVRVVADPTTARLPPEAPFGWPSGSAATIDVTSAEFGGLLKDLAALYAEEDPDAAIAYSFYVQERDRSRQRIGQLLAHADWTRQLDVLRETLTRGERIVLVGEDLGIDPANGRPSVPLTTPNALAALAELSKGGRLYGVNGLREVLLLQVGRGWLVLDRSSPDRLAGSGPSRMNDWMDAWRGRMAEAGLLPGREPDAARLIPMAADADLRAWFCQ